MVYTRNTEKDKGKSFTIVNECNSATPDRTLPLTPSTVQSTPSHSSAGFVDESFESSCLSDKGSPSSFVLSSPRVKVERSDLVRTLFPEPVECRSDLNILNVFDNDNVPVSESKDEVDMTRPRPEVGPPEIRDLEANVAKSFKDQYTNSRGRNNANSLRNRSHQKLPSLNIMDKFPSPHTSSKRNFFNNHISTKQNHIHGKRQVAALHFTRRFLLIFLPISMILVLLPLTFISPYLPSPTPRVVHIEVNMEYHHRLLKADDHSRSGRLGFDGHVRDRINFIRKNLEEKVSVFSNPIARSTGVGLLDANMYVLDTVVKRSKTKRVVILHQDVVEMGRHKNVEVDHTVFSDNTQLYGILDSEDEALSSMEIIRPDEESASDCKSEQWHHDYFPDCNTIHELDLVNRGNNHIQSGEKLQLFKKQGHWRNAWKVSNENEENETVILKTPRFVHNFEQKFFETDRNDALAMASLTGSPFVIDIYSFCGRTVLTEFAGGSLSKVIEKAKKKKFKRLRMARDLAFGLAQIHYGIDHNETTTRITHFDINPANVVVSSSGDIKFNDFNIAQMVKRNVTSGAECTMPQHNFPNPLWRSPEEVQETGNLSPKVDVYSLGHIFYKIICEGRPYDRFEKHRLSKVEIENRVKAGVLPRLCEGGKTSSDPEIVAIREAMNMCYTRDPKSRPSSKDVAKFLDHRLHELKLKGIGN